MIFTHTGYDLKFIQQKQIIDESEHLSTSIYTFISPVTKLKYVVNLEYYNENLYVIKFYPKSLKKSLYKYNRITNKGDVLNILITCAKLIPQILRENQSASFGFIGSRTYDVGRAEFQENYFNNKRFRVYSKLIQDVIGSKTFEHYEYIKISGYLLVNKTQKPVTEKERRIIDMLHRVYYLLEDLD